MAFYLSKEQREKRASEKEIAKQEELQRKRKQEEFQKKREQEFLDKYQKERNEYCEWLTEKTNQFKNELSQINFRASMGFEVEDVINLHYGIGSKQIADVTVFDIPKLSGIAFDFISKQMIYFKCKGQYYENYNNYKQPIYEYIVIEFGEIFNVKIDINNVTTYDTVSNKDILKRSIAGGLLAGGAGAIIGGTTAQPKNTSETLPEKIVFTIQTNNEKAKVIQFEFGKDYYNPNSKVLSDKEITDTMISIFSNQTTYCKFRDEKTKRKCDTNIDYIYERIYIEPADFDEEFFYEKEKIGNLEIISKRLNKYAMQIESIIHQNSNGKDNEPINSIADEIAKLVSLKESGVLNDEEFNTLKAKIISR